MPTTITVDPTVPQASESPRLGYLRIQGVAAWLLQLFGFSGTAATTFANAPFGIDANNLVTVEADPQSALGIATKEYVDGGHPGPGGLTNGIITVTNGGSGASYTGTTLPSFVSYPLGPIFQLLFTQEVTAANPTVNLNSVGPIALVDGGSSALLPGTIVAGQIAEFVFDGTNFQMVSPSDLDDHFYATLTGGPLNYTGTLVPAPLSYQTGVTYFLTFNVGNSGGTSLNPVTVNLNSLGPLSVLKNGTSQLAAGDITANQIIQLIYDGAEFQVLGPLATINQSGGYTAASISGTNATVGSWGNLTLGSFSPITPITAPAGGPFRLVVSYFIPISQGGTAGDIEFQVTDGTHQWALSGAHLAASGDGYVHATEESPTTYAAGATPTINIQCWATHASSASGVGGVSPASGTQAYLKCWWVASA